VDHARLGRDFSHHRADCSDPWVRRHRGASFAAAKIIFFIAIILLLLAIVFGAVRRPL
jgi:hypothetical protein